jgi:hypothetical protein
MNLIGIMLDSFRKTTLASTTVDNRHLTTYRPARPLTWTPLPGSVSSSKMPIQRPCPHFQSAPGSSPASGRYPSALGSP